MPPSTINECQEGPLVDPLGDFMGYQLRRASAWILADLSRSLADLDLRPSEASILLLIDANAGISQSDIGRMLGIKSANMAPLAASLADRGLIGKARADGRSQALHLTQKGQAILPDIAHRIAVHESRFLQRLSADERSRLALQIRAIWQPQGPR